MAATDSEKAIAQDPAYALAYSGLADCHRVIRAYGAVPGREVFLEAKAAPEKTLEVAPALGEARG